MLSRGRIPVISPWLYRRSLQPLSRRAREGDPSVVSPLADVYCTTTDRKARAVAEQALVSLAAPVPAKNLLYEAILRGDDDLAALVLDAQGLPLPPEERSLLLFCSGHAALNPDSAALLAAGYAAAPQAVQARVRDAARSNGTCPHLARALTGTDVAENAARWSYDEWDVIITGIAAEQRWNDLWLLAVLAPLPLAVTATAALKGSGWSPAGDDRPVWDEIAARAVDRWDHPQPAGGTVPQSCRPAGQVNRLAFSRDGSLLAAGSCDGTVTVRPTASAGAAAAIPAGEGSAWSLLFAGGGLVYGGDDGRIGCFSLADATRTWTWDGKAAAPPVLSADGRTVLAAGPGRDLFILGADDGRLSATLPLHASPVTCLAAGPGGDGAACGHDDGSVSFVRPGDSAPRVLAGSGSPVRSLAFLPGGDRCLVVHGNGRAVLCDPRTALPVRTFTGPAGQAVCSAVPPGGGWFAAGGSDHMLRWYDLSGEKEPVVLPLYSRSITCCAASPDGRFLAAGFHDGSIRILGIPGPALLREVKGHRKPVITCTFSPDSTRLATAGWDETVKLWHVPDGQILRTFDLHAGRVAALAGPAGTLLATVTEDGTARLIDGTDGRTLRTIDLYTPVIRTAAMSPDGSLLAATGTDASLRLWNLRDSALVAAGGTLVTSQWCCTFIPMTETLATGGWDGKVRVFRVPDLTLLRTLTGHTSIVTCCAAAPGGSILATGSNDTTVRLWRTGEDTAYAVLRESRTAVSALAVSGTGTLLAAGSADGIIRIWRIPCPGKAAEIPGLSGTVTALTFLPDGCLLCAGYDSGVVAFFSLPERRLVRTLPVHAGAVTGMAVPAGTGTLATTGADGICRFSPLPQTPCPARTLPGDREDYGAGCTGGEGCEAQQAFLRAVFAARFRDEICLCPSGGGPGPYDIGITG